MADVAHTNLRQWCVAWKKLDTKTQRGQVRLQSAINVKCRWLENEQYQVSQDSTQQTIPRSVQVAVDIPLGSYIWGEGRIKDLPSSPQYLEVVARSKTPDLKGRHPVYTLSLQKASRTLPTVVS